MSNIIPSMLLNSFFGTYNTTDQHLNYLVLCSKMLHILDNVLHYLKLVQQFFTKLTYANII